MWNKARKAISTADPRNAGDSTGYIMKSFVDIAFGVS
jgi:hypothetical protein